MELTDKSGNSNRAIMFNGGDRIEDILLKKNYSKENCRDAEINIDALYTLEINEYKELLDKMQPIYPLVSGLN